MSDAVMVPRADPDAIWLEPSCCADPSHCGPGGYLDCGKPATDKLRAAIAKAYPPYKGGV